MQRVSPAAVAARWVVLGAVALVALLAWPLDGLDGVMSGRAYLVVVGGAGAAALLAVVAVRTGLVVRWSPVLLAAVVFAATMVVASLTSPAPLASLVGEFQRWSGAGLYLGCVALFVTVVSLGDRGFLDRLIRTVVVASLVLSLLAIAEALGVLDGVGADVAGVRATLGNPNFLAGWLAVSIPLGLVLALDDRQLRPWRLAGGIGAALAVVAAVLTLSVQGPLAGGAGAAVTVLVVLAGRWPARRMRLVVGGTLAAVVLALAVGIAGVAGAGPLAAAGDQAGVEHRLYYWSAAVEMVAEQPVTGVGPERFGVEYRQYRPLADAVESPLTDTADAAHSVPLQLAAGGGLLVALPYVAVLVLVTVAWWRSLRALDARGRLLAAGFGGAWVAYLLQSFVSLDVPPLAALGWVVAGAIVCLASQPTEPAGGTGQAPSRRGRSRGPQGRHRHQAWTPPQVATAAVAGAGVLAVAWFAAVPLRADATARTVAASVTGAAGGADTDPERDPDQTPGPVRAAELASWEPVYGMNAVEFLLSEEDADGARTQLEQVVARSPDSLEGQLTAARFAAEQDETDTARTRYEQALTLEPQHPDLAVEVAEFALVAGDREWGAELVERALAVDPDNEDAQRLADEL